MAASDIIEPLLSKTGLPFAHRFFKPYKNKPVPNPPYLIYLILKTEGHGADDKVLYKKYHVAIELYTDKRSPSIMEKVEYVISEYEYTSDEDYIEEEDMYLVVYEFDVIEKIRRNENV